MQAPSFKFTDGVLYVDTSLAQMRLKWRPDPSAEELAVGRRRWHPFLPEFRLLRAPESQGKESVYTLEIQADITAKEIAEQKAAAFAAFREEIEPDIVHVVELFGSHQWALMTLMHDEHWAKELAVGNPVLAYALANSDQFRRSPPEAAAVQARWYCHRKQRELLEWLGFPGTEAVVRIIRKIPPESASPSILRRLSNALKADRRVLEYLSHLKTVNNAVLELVTVKPYLDLITSKLLAEVAALPYVPGESTVADAIHAGMVLLNECSPDLKMKPMTSIKQASRFRAEVDRAYQDHQRRQEMARQEARRIAEQERHRLHMVATAHRRTPATSSGATARREFPPPPIPGTENIVPLTSAEHLHVEGKEQENCVATYGGRIRSGGTYVYRILAPERATLAIVRCADGCWYRSELSARCNGKIKLATERAVDMWLAKARLSI